MARIGIYGFLNAKVRAMRSALLTEALFRNLAGSKGFQEFLNLLHQTHYRNLAEKGRTAAPETLESELFRDEVERIHHLEHYSEGDVRRFISLFLQRYEAERLKIILRYRDSVTPDEFPWMRERIAFNLPVDALLSAKRFDEVLYFLEGTPFEDDLRQVSSPSDNKFSVETAIDQGVFERLWDAVSALGKKDADIAGRILGIEVDLRNLEAIGRFRRYYQIPAGRMTELFLPRGYRLNVERLITIASGGSLSDTLSGVLKESRLRTTESQDDNDDIALIEHSLYNVLLTEAKRAFGQFPFSIGSLMGYLTLLRIESRNLRVLIQSKVYGLTSDETEALLIF